MPLYPCGYGLSCRQFDYSNLQIQPGEIYNQGIFQAHVDVENAGKIPSLEAVQLYVHKRFTPVATPVKQLRGFERVALAPGEKKTVSFTLGPEDLQLLNRDMRWVVVPGTFDIMIGKSSADIALKGRLTSKQRRLLISNHPNTVVIAHTPDPTIVLVSISENTCILTSACGK